MVIVIATVVVIVVALVDDVTALVTNATIINCMIVAIVVAFVSVNIANDTPAMSVVVIVGIIYVIAMLLPCHCHAIAM